MRNFNSETVKVETHGSNGPYHPKPAVNVKVRRGFEALSAEQWDGLRMELRSYEPALAPETAQRFGREYLEAFEREQPERFYETWYAAACEAGFEQAEETARELFGRAVKCYSAGRMGGWLIVEGLPDVDAWDTEDGYPVGSLGSIKGTSLEGASFADGTPLSDSPGYFEAWAFFCEVCESLAQDTPYRCADLIACNVFAREEATRPVEFLRALPGGIWDTRKLEVPGKIKASDALVAFGTPKLADSGEELALVAVYNDPLAD